MHSQQDQVFLSLHWGLGQSATGKCCERYCVDLEVEFNFSIVCSWGQTTKSVSRVTFPYLADTLWPCRIAAISTTFSATWLELKSDSWDKSFLTVCGHFLPQTAYCTDLYGTSRIQMRWLTALIWCSRILFRCPLGSYLQKLWAYRLVRCRLLDLLTMRCTVKSLVLFLS